MFQNLEFFRHVEMKIIDSFIALKGSNAGELVVSYTRTGRARENECV